MNEHTENNKMTMTRFTEMMHNVSGALMLGGQTLIAAFFVVVILILILVVDIQRVSHGIALFEDGKWLTIGGGFVLIMALMTLEFVAHYIEAKYNYHKPAKKHLSWRLIVEWWDYFSGQNDSWKAREKTPALHIRKYAGTLKIAILMLALAGSMADEISTLPGNWIDGFVDIGTQSSLLDMVRYTTSLLYTYVLVSGAELLTAYVANRAAEYGKQAVSGDTNTVQEVAELSEHQSIVSVMDIEPASPDLLNAEYHRVECICGWSKEYDNANSSAKGLKAHQQSCKIYQDFAKQVIQDSEWIEV